MVRPLRLELPGALYHATARGNTGQELFLNEDDRRAFLDILDEVVERYRFICHAYCLMGNHYHGSQSVPGDAATERRLHPEVQPQTRKERARWKYRRFVSAGKGVRIWDELQGGIVLGREDFVEGLKPLLQGKIRGGDRAAGEVGPRPSLGELFAGAQERGDREERIYRAVMEYGYKVREVGAYMGLHYSTVSRIVGRQKSKVKTCPPFGASQEVIPELLLPSPP